MKKQRTKSPFNITNSKLIISHTGGPKKADALFAHIKKELRRKNSREPTEREILDEIKKLPRMPKTLK